MELDPLAGLRIANFLRVPRDEEPLLLRREFALDPGDGQPAGDGLVDDFLGNRLAGRPVHHRRGDFVRGDQRVERRRARLGTVGLVEAAVIDGPAAVADVDVRGLRERREQLVGGVGGEDRRSVSRVVGRIAPHRETVPVHRIEARVAVPRLVEVDPVHALSQQRFGVPGVIAHPVVGAVGEHRVDRTLAGRLFRQRIRGDLLRDGLGRETRRQDRADDAVPVAGGAQKHRNSAGENQALFDGLVTVAIAEGDLVVPDAGLHDGAVRGRGPVEHGIGATRAEHPRDVLLALSDRAEVPEQRAQRAALDPHVGPEDVLAVEVEERPPDRGLEETGAALVSRSGPRVLALPVILRQRRGKGRQQALDVAARVRRRHGRPRTRSCPRAATRTRR